MLRKGFALPLVLAATIVLVLLGGYYYSRNQNLQSSNLPAPTSFTLPTPITSDNLTSNIIQGEIVIDYGEYLSGNINDHINLAIVETENGNNVSEYFAIENGDCDENSNNCIWISETSQNMRTYAYHLSATPFVNLEVGSTYRLELTAVHKEIDILNAPKTELSSPITGFTDTKIDIFIKENVTTQDFSLKANIEDY